MERVLRLKIPTIERNSDGYLIGKPIRVVTVPKLSDPFQRSRERFVGQLPMNTYRLDNKR